jgi:uncharacterized protein YjcR
MVTKNNTGNEGGDGLAVPVQPRDRNHPIYKAMKKYLQPGDYKSIGEKLGRSPNTVRQIAYGRPSAKIWESLIEVVKEKKKQEKAFIEYLNK